MKPIFIRLLAFLLPLTTVLSANSQTRIQTLAFSKTVLDSAAKNLVRMEMEAAAESDRTIMAGMKTSSPRVYHNFTTKFSAAYEIDMEVRKNVHISFLVNGVRNRSLYSKSGRLLHNIRYYDASLIPDLVASTVYSSFPTYKIFSGITEVEARGNIIYFVLIEDAKTWKQVKVHGDTIEVHEDCIKTPDQIFAANDY